MSNAGIDQNSNQTATARLNTDGKTVTQIFVSSSTHRMAVDDNTTGSNNGGSIAATDDNGRTTMYAESSDGTLVALYANSSNQLLINSM